MIKNKTVRGITYVAIAFLICVVFVNFNAKIPFSPYEKYLVYRSEKGDVNSMRKLCRYYLLRDSDKKEELLHWAKALAETGDESASNLVARIEADK